jgi:hypothetical protein
MLLVALTPDMIDSYAEAFRMIRNITGVGAGSGPYITLPGCMSNISL